MEQSEHEAFLAYMEAQGYSLPEHRVEVGPVEAEVERDCDYIDALTQLAR